MYRLRYAVIAILVVLMFGGAVSAEPTGVLNTNLLDEFQARGVNLRPGTMFNPKDLKILEIGETGVDPFKYLQERKSKDVEPRYMVEKLNPKFAQCFTRMVQELEKQGMSIEVRSGYRTTSDQRVAQSTTKIAATTGNSAHEYGIAVDVMSKKHGFNLNAPEYAWIRQNAPRFGLGLLTTEAGHIEARTALCGVGEYSGGLAALKTSAQDAKAGVPDPFAVNGGPPVLIVPDKALELSPDFSSGLNASFQETPGTLRLPTVNTQGIQFDPPPSGQAVVPMVPVMQDQTQIRLTPEVRSDLDTGGANSFEKRSDNTFGYTQDFSVAQNQIHLGNTLQRYAENTALSFYHGVNTIIGI